MFTPCATSASTKAAAVVPRISSLKPGDWGWNRCGDEFWVVAIADIDLSTIVADVLSSDGS